MPWMASPYVQFQLPLQTKFRRHVETTNMSRGLGAAVQWRVLVVLGGDIVVQYDCASSPERFLQVEHSTLVA